MRPASRACLGMLAAALLAACSVEPHRPPAVPAPELPQTPLPPLASPTATAPEPPAATKPTEVSPWQRLRQRFAMQGCSYRPQVARWAKRYAQSPRRFAASWERALPFVLVVLDELERRDLPGEFAMLPYVESSYDPGTPHGYRPAGLWQLDFDTARGQGVVIDADYDGRLDVITSTTAALDLIEKYEREFGDWRLADMAFNSGEYRVKALLHGRDAHALDAAELGKLAFNPITHDHLDRLLALACIIEDPAKFNVELPEPSPSDRLETVALESGMDVRLAARLAGMDPADLKRLNAGYRRNRMASRMPYRLVMPSDRVERFRAASKDIPVALWNDWREERAARTSGLASWAAEVGIPVAVLAAANAIGADTTVGPTTRLLLPGRETETRSTDSRDDDKQRARVHVVKAGDTLSSIAHRYDMRVDALKKLNPKSHGLLHPGDKLRVGATD